MIIRIPRLLGAGRLSVDFLKLQLVALPTTATIFGPTGPLDVLQTTAPGG